MLQEKISLQALIEFAKNCKTILYSDVLKVSYRSHTHFSGEGLNI